MPISIGDLPAKLLSTPALNGAILAGIGITMFGSLGNSSTIAGVSLPAPLVDFAFGAIASLGADIATDYVLPQVTKDEKVKMLEAKIANPVAAGVLLVGLSGLTLSSSFDSRAMLQVFAMGAGSELGALYSFDILKGLLH